MPEFPSFRNIRLDKLGMKEMVANIHEIDIDEWLKAPLEATNESIFKRVRKYLTSIIS